MADAIEVKVPDIGGTKNAEVIEILVNQGDNIAVDTPLITLESDKASMEIPSAMAGIVDTIKVKVGDKLSEGDLILLLKTDKVTSVPAQLDEKSNEKVVSEINKTEGTKSNSQFSSVEVTIPDIGGATNVDVIAILVQEGDTVTKEQSLVTLEGDKATMDIPSPHAGVVKKLRAKLGDKVSQGSPIVLLEVIEGSTTLASEKSAPPIVQSNEQITPITSLESEGSNKPFRAENPDLVFAGPAVRRIAREFGVDLNQVKGSGRKERVTREDVQAYVKSCLAQRQMNPSNPFNLPAMPAVDFSKFGEVEIKPLNKIKKLTGLNVHRSWITIPHVTQFDEADITDLETFRKDESDKVTAGDYKLTLLAFVCAVVSKALTIYPQFNASLDSTGENLVYKKYCNIGIAVETPNGLVVPVIKDVDQLSVLEIAKEMGRLSAKARDKGLMPVDMSGGCFTISSLGGIGGTAFTPIVNSPEVAILGLSRATIKPIYSKEQFIPRLMLPLSLSYDHRVIDGAEAARFTRYVGDCLADIRKIVL